VGFNDNGGWVDAGATSGHDDGGAEAGGWLNGDGAGIFFILKIKKSFFFFPTYSFFNTFLISPTLCLSH